MALASNLENFTAVIANGEALSGAIALGALQPAAILLPGTWTAASLSFQGSLDDGTTWGEIINSAGALGYTVAAGQLLVLSPDAFWGINHIKIRSGTSGSPVNQGAARTLIVRARPRA